VMSKKVAKVREESDKMIARIKGEAERAKEAIIKEMASLTIRRDEMKDQIRVYQQRFAVPV